MRMAVPVRVAFEDRTVLLPLDAVMPLRTLAPDLRQSVRWKRIAASIAEVGVIEPIVVSPKSGKAGAWLLLDGHVRVAILRERGETEARCLGHVLKPTS